MSPRQARRARPPLLSVHDVVSPRIHRTVDGVRIGHLTDIHVRVGVPPRRLHRAIELLNALRPDLVVLTGDYVCFSSRPLPGLAAALKALTVPAFATLGNHDHWSGAAKVARALESAGIDVLTNEHRTLQIRGGTLHLVGVDDPVTRHHDPDKAFRDVPLDDGATRVVLAHDPSFAEALVPYRPAVVFSGHTHGGQIVFKRLTPYMAQRIGIKYLSGFFEIDGAMLYVSRGLGESLPVRFRAPPECSQLTLRSAAAGASASSAAA
ncbi:MAG: metallophosphoesterase [Myxococcaceae bacterium]|nr:metallophosphoesterase [Myxococcaceae bacterium]